MTQKCIDVTLRYENAFTWYSDIFFCSCPICKSKKWSLGKHLPTTLCKFQNHTQKISFYKKSNHKISHNQNSIEEFKTNWALESWLEFVKWEFLGIFTDTVKCLLFAQLKANLRKCFTPRKSWMVRAFYQNCVAFQQAQVVLRDTPFATTPTPLLVAKINANFAFKTVRLKVNLRILCPTVWIPTRIFLHVLACIWTRKVGTILENVTKSKMEWKNGKTKPSILTRIWKPFCNSAMILEGICVLLNPVDNVAPKMVSILI